MVHSVYAREIATCLAQYTGGNYVHIFDLNTRALLPTFETLQNSGEQELVVPKTIKLRTPQVRNGLKGTYDLDTTQEDVLQYFANSQPSLTAHADYDPSSTRDIIDSLWGDEPNPHEGKRYLQCLASPQRTSPRSSTCIV